MLHEWMARIMFVMKAGVFQRKLVVEVCNRFRSHLDLARNNLVQPFNLFKEGSLSRSKQNTVITHRDGIMVGSVQPVDQFVVVLKALYCLVIILGEFRQIMGVLT